jgi:hypothetical protein
MPSLLVYYSAGVVLRRSAPLVLLGPLTHAAHITLRPHQRPLVIGSVVVVGAVIARRLEGFFRDARKCPDRLLTLLVDRLVYDRRPGWGPDARDQ